jgi:hypothetical protein
LPVLLQRHTQGRPAHRRHGHSMGSRRSTSGEADWRRRKPAEPLDSPGRTRGIA